MKSAVGEAFNLNGTEEITWNQYFARFNDALGLPELRENQSEDRQSSACHQGASANPWQNLW